MLFVQSNTMVLQILTKTHKKRIPSVFIVLQTMTISVMCYFIGRNFSEQKLSPISWILAKFAKVNVARFFMDIDPQKFMNAKNIFFLNSQKLIFAKKIKNRIFNSFYLFQTTNFIKLVQILKRFSQELNS